MCDVSQKAQAVADMLRNEPCELKVVAHTVAALVEEHARLRHQFGRLLDATEQLSANVNTVLYCIAAMEKRFSEKEQA